jgi:hypothetical protein
MADRARSNRPAMNAVPKTTTALATNTELRPVQLAIAPSTGPETPSATSIQAV